jgi:hypothetical protein
MNDVVAPAATPETNAAVDSIESLAPIGEFLGH